MNMNCRPSLHRAVRSSDLATVRRLIDQGANVNELRGDETPLHLITRENNVPAVQLLLGGGADVSIANSWNETPIYFVVNCKQDVRYDMYKLLLENGAQCMEGTAFLKILKYVNLETVKLFLNHGANIAVTVNFGVTAIHYAAQNVFFAGEILEFLVNQGFDINGSVEQYLSPLHLAALSGASKGCEFLLKHGALVNKKSRFTGRIPLVSVFMQVMPQVPIVKILLDYGADLSETVKEESILKIACRKDYVYDRKEFKTLTSLLMEYMAKRQYQNLYINEDDRHTIKTEGCYRNYFKMCLQELERMGNTKFYNNFSVVNVLLKSQKVISGYARNAGLVKAFEECVDRSLFRIYFDSLKERLDTELARYKRRSDAAKVLSDVLMFNDFVHPVNQKIISYLKDEALKFLEIEINYID